VLLDGRGALPAPLAVWRWTTTGLDAGDNHAPAAIAALPRIVDRTIAPLHDRRPRPDAAPAGSVVAPRIAAGLHTPSQVA
jgi:hypothetical protein